MARYFKLLDHTADIGIRATADTLEELVRAAGEALYEIIGRLEATGDRRRIQLAFSADEPALLLRDYLAELLVLVERDGTIVTEVEVPVFDEDRLEAIAEVAAVDHERCAYHREVKAITYHELDLHRTDNGYEATLIVDI